MPVEISGSEHCRRLQVSDQAHACHFSVLGAASCLSFLCLFVRRAAFFANPATNLHAIIPVACKKKVVAASEHERWRWPMVSDPACGCFFLPFRSVRESCGECTGVILTFEYPAFSPDLIRLPQQRQSPKTVIACMETEHFCDFAEVLLLT